MQKKSNTLGLVTEADLKSEKMIKAFINKNFPHHSILAEESGWEKDNAKAKNQPLWLIDPIDGTTNFSKGNLNYCVSIAFGLRTGNTCDILVSCIYHPPTGDLFLAEKGGGTTCNGKKVTVSKEKNFKNGLYSTGMGASSGAKLKKIMKTIYKIQSQCVGSAVRIEGAAALDLAHVAFGISQGFWERNLNPWDTAAGQLLVKEAGGIVTNEKGQLFDPLRDRYVVASTKAAHKALLKNIK